VKKGPGGADCEIAIVGAGPYGLATAAHLKAVGIEPLVFGETMGFWRHNMPAGMLLRSPWTGNHIADPDGRYTLDAYGQTCGLKPTDLIPIEDYIRYGEWFQQQAVPVVDPRRVTRVEPAPAGFRLLLQGGDAITAANVLMAIGLTNQAYRPPQFDGIPDTLASHVSVHQRLDHFRGQHVAVVGRGQMACEFAVLLHEAGADVEILSRGVLRWTGTEKRGSGNGGGLRSRLSAALTPPSPIGPFPLNWVVDTPSLIRSLPRKVRDRIDGRTLRPTASRWLLPRADGVRMTSGTGVTAAQVRGNAILLQLDNGGAPVFDHVILATGYRTDVAKQGILAPELLSGVETAEGSPVLSRGYQSTIPRLYFAGSAAIHSYGPLLRSIRGAGHAARSVTRAVLRNR
jgi:cation diffusion facilitator CzcD-associated flavoprotein CzcO